MTYLNREEVPITTNNPEEDGAGSTIVEEVHHYHYEDDLEPYTYTMFKWKRIVWFIAVVLEILIGFRVLLKLIAANPQSGFANFIYTVTTLLLAPFAGLTTAPSANGIVLEISSLIAMIVYAILFWLALYAIKLLWWR